MLLLDLSGCLLIAVDVFICHLKSPSKHGSYPAVFVNVSISMHLANFSFLHGSGTFLSKKIGPLSF